MKDVTKNTLKRIASAVIGLPVYAYCVITDQFYSIPILFVSLVISLGCLWEFYKMADRGNEGHAFIFEGMTIGFFINIFLYIFAFAGRYDFLTHFNYLDPRGTIFFFMLIIVLTLVLQVFGRQIKGATYSLGVTVFGVIFIVGFFSHLILLKAVNNGMFHIFMLNAVVMLNDSGGYFGGVYLGRHRTDFPVSPNKTWEGYISGLLFSIAGMLLFNWLFSYYFNVRLFSYPEACVFGAFLSVVGNVGDLVESTVKRDNNAKDSGKLVPGHGGMWDVFDAVLVALPVYYYYLILRGYA